MLFFVLFCCAVAALTLPFAVTEAMASKRDIPIVSVETQKNEIALTANVYADTDTDYLLNACKGTKVTFFISEEVQELCPEKVLKILSSGHTVGLLLGDVKGKSKEEIYDLLAQRIETFAHLTGKNTELVRFDENRYDANAVKAVYYLGLEAVQWATDDTAEYFSKGDIILLTGESDLVNFIKKTAAEGFVSVSLDELIIKESYKVDLRGVQSNK